MDFISVYFNRITDMLASAKGTALLLTWNGVNATFIWIKPATEIVGLLSAVIALACGGFTLYGHIERARAKHDKET